MRILTMQSPGRRTRSDAHLPFDPASPASYLRRRPANFGDYVVIDSMLKVIDGDVVGNVQLAPPSDAPLPAADHLVIRGANYIRSNFDLSGMGDVIERLGLPVTVMGIGAQAPDYGKLELPKGTIRALRILGEHSNVVGARGAYTAEVLTELGVDNVEPIGCPSFFRAMNRDLAITLDAQAIGSVAYNMNRHMTGIYGSDSLLVNRIQRSFFMELKRSFGVVWTFCQGELPEFIAAHRLEEHYATLKSQLVRSGFANSESDPIIDDLVASAVCATSVTDWEQRISDVDLVIGMRFHGTTVGLSNGVPSIYLVNDTRIHELATHFAVPYVDVRKLDAPPSIDSIVEAADFGPFNAQYADRFDRFADYLHRNGLPSKMQRRSRLDSELRYANSELSPEADPDASRQWLRSQLLWTGRRIASLQKVVDSAAG